MHVLTSFSQGDFLQKIFISVQNTHKNSLLPINTHIVLTCQPFSCPPPGIVQIWQQTRCDKLIMKAPKAIGRNVQVVADSRSLLFINTKHSQRM